MNGLKFQFYCGEQVVKKLVFEGSQTRTLSIGRVDTDIPLPDPRISRMHAQLLYDGSVVYIIDFNSSGGTFLNNTKIVINEPQLLKNGDIVTFDSSGFSRLEVSSRREAVDTPVVRQDPGNTIFSKLKDKNEITIGRSPDCDIVLDHRTVSRRHATVRKEENNKYIITDENSVNGVFLNGSRIRRAEISINDQLFIGRFQLSLNQIGHNLSKESAVKAELVSKQYRNGYHALKQTTFDLPAGGVIAIMGPSGCGKSTLLKVLNGTIFPTTGNVFINGLDLVENLAYLKTQIGYVPQDDIVHGQLTVRQSLYYAAKIRLNGVSDELIEKKTAVLLKKLNIAFISNNLISAISGGQRKRVSIAVELLSDPAILFLDEPTSPLDPQTIAEFMKILRDLSEGGTTVIMVTHKPEDLTFMDKVIFMAEGGSLAYYGDVNEYRSYFEVTAPIEVYANISGDRADYWVKKFAGISGLSASLPASQRKRKEDKSDPFLQFYWLLSRYFRIKLNDRKNTLFTVLQAPIIAALICLVFREIRLGVLFLTTISAIWFGINNSAREIVSEEPVYKRERMFNLLIFPYIFSKIALLAALAFIQSVLYISILKLYYANNTVSWEPWLMGIVWMFFITFCASLTGLFISAASKTTEKAMTVVPLVIIPQIMLAGVVAIINSSVVELLSYFTIARWGTEGFTHIQDNVTEIVQHPVKQIAVPETMEAYKVMKRSFHDTYQMIFGENAGTFRLDLVMLALIGTISFVCIWIFMKKRDKSQL
ncbi:MAG: FHA domain-containing protein [Chitinophagaceae bacterium]